MKELKYPFDAELLLKRKRKIKRNLLAQISSESIKIKIAILGGSTTKNIKEPCNILLT